MFIDYWLQYKKNTSSEHVVYKNCCLLLFWYWYSKQCLYTACSELVFFLYWSQYIINEQSAIILWVNWFKNECFWKRFTCTCCNSPLGILYIIDVFWYYYGTIQVLRQQRGGWVGSENGNFCWFTVHTIYAKVSRWMGLKKPKTCWRNTWMVPIQR